MIKNRFEGRNCFEFESEGSEKNGEEISIESATVFEGKEICDRVDFEAFGVYLYVSVDVG